MDGHSCKTGSTANVLKRVWGGHRGPPVGHGFGSDLPNQGANPRRESPVGGAKGVLLAFGTPSCTTRTPCHEARRRAPLRGLWKNFTHFPRDNVLALFVLGSGHYFYGLFLLPVTCLLREEHRKNWFLWEVISEKCFRIQCLVRQRVHVLSSVYGGFRNNFALFCVKAKSDLEAGSCQVSKPELLLHAASDDQDNRAYEKHSCRPETAERDCVYTHARTHALTQTHSRKCAGAYACADSEAFYQCPSVCPRLVGVKTTMLRSVGRCAQEAKSCALLLNGMWRLFRPDVHRSATAVLCVHICQEVSTVLE